jgi:hypothetical protein
MQSMAPTLSKTSTLNLLASIIKPKTKMILLCDKSSTMIHGGRIKAQRRCVYSIANASIENNSALVLSYWNSKLHWVSSVSSSNDHHVAWQRGEEILSSFRTLETVQPEGGHDMRNALEV